MVEIQYNVVLSAVVGGEAGGGGGGHCMGTIDSRMKTLHISNKGPYIDTGERFQIFSESKRRGWGMK